MTNGEFISRISSVLEHENIKKMEQLVQCPSILTTSINCYNDLGKNWVFEIYQTVREYFKGFQLNHSRPTHFVSTELDDNTLKYMCIFPSSIVLTEPFVSASTCGTAAMDYRINRSFLELVLNNREYIKHDIFSILPRSFDLEMAYSTGWSVTTLSGNHTYRTPEYINRDPTELLDSNGIALTRERISELFFKFPFLYGARIEDYINITTKYKTHYELYRALIQEFVKKLDSDGNAIEDLYYEMQKAHQQMQIHFEIEQNNLLKKGIRTVVGIAIACIPFVLDVPTDLRYFLQSVLGTMTLKELSNDILETQKNLNALQQNPYFVTWRWKRKSPNRPSEF